MNNGSLTHRLACALPAALGLFLLGLTMQGCGDQFSWRNYQKAYVQSLAAISETAAKNFRPGQRVVDIPELGARDRCTTCHVAMEDMRLFGQANPLKPHPADYLRQHPQEKFGCTVCHGGKGQTLHPKQAHSGDFRKGDLVQVACSKCHSEESLAGAPDLSQGKALLKSLQCTQCHYIRNFSETALFRPAPSLKGVGSKVKEDWLHRWLSDPPAALENARMPRYQIEEKYIDALAGYLMQAAVQPAAPASAVPPGDESRGEAALRLAFCITCHPFNGKGGNDAPDLGKIGSKVKEDWLVRMLADPHAQQPQTPMPRYNLTAQQVSDIAAYLVTEFIDYDLPEPDDSTQTPVYWADANERVEIGRKVYKELRCANCHGTVEAAAGWQNGWQQIGPDLSRIGSKPVNEITFGESPIPRTLPDYLFEKIRNPQAFATAENPLKMPQYRLSDKQISDIVLALLSFTADTLAAPAYRVPQKSPPLYEPQGEFGRLVDKFRCWSCHSFKGRGHNITYDLSLEGSRVQRQWLFNYLKLSYTIRPILPIRMPIFNMTDEEAEALTAGFMRDMVSSDIPESLEMRLNPALAAEGEKLFAARGCLACHQVSQQGGYVGPSFTEGALAGDKLRAGWIFNWLKNPQAIKPDVLEPNYGFSDDEALRLTAYLMSINSTNAKAKPNK